ncbi:ATP-binding protein [Corallococcus interemptor]|uniref:ATP-binding protein n=1 Tax=Corallococcus interemptor TaxID=2316720 RepID=A0A3A8QLP7_9BACT|nr:AAA family ATPase [Corallococcus interemptor]RKH69613.1 ATP-binding protein [Corallococcus interemptor]
MSAPLPEAQWPQANQRHLTAALGVVRAHLSRHARASGADVPEGADDVDAARAALAGAQASMPAPPALDVLVAAFGLSSFERDVLLCCAGVELDSGFGAVCASAQGDPRRAFATFGLALVALPDAHWSALTPVAPLRRWELVTVMPGEGLTHGALRVDERVLHYLAGLSYLDRRLRDLVSPVPPAAALPASHEALVGRIQRAWEQGPGLDGGLVVQLCGPEAEGAQAVASAACAAQGLTLHTLRASHLPAPLEERAALGRLWEREALLAGSGLLLECDDAAGAEGLRAAASFAERAEGLVLLSTREPLRLRGRPVLHLDVRRPTREEQRVLWHQALGPASERVNGALERVVSQFDLSMRSIRAAGAEVRQVAGDADGAPAGEALWSACRLQARPGLEDLAQRIEPSAGWDDLVLPELQKTLLRQVAACVRQRVRVYETWGFAAQGSRGLGISALFSGASGTGKTMAAEVLARELGLDLFRIDLSQVVSKYIGETEKNLRRVFEAAQEGGAILLFDEADALFGKRTEVKDSHDRYANIEVSYLLQQMEAYSGLAILTTNMKDALDTAFLRRLRFVVQFPFPDSAQRAEIWRRMFPPSAPTESLEVARLARLSVTGGNIRTIALNAAFLAADAGEPVRMAHLQRAVRAEFSKLDKPLAEAEIAGWV